MVRAHINLTLGRVKLNTLNAAHVHSLYREKLDAGLAPERSGTPTPR